jgi:hypothetical protein
MLESFLVWFGKGVKSRVRGTVSMLSIRRTTVDLQVKEPGILLDK